VSRPQPSGNLQSPGAEGQKTDAGDRIGDGVDFNEVAQQHGEAQYQGEDAYPLRESIG
jgi:hypothetical protein